MRKFLKAVVLCSALSMMAPMASACPSCKNANETDDMKPRAYMYSILFMLAMPASILGGYGVIFWRVRRAAASTSEAESIAESN